MCALLKKNSEGTHLCLLNFSPVFNPTKIQITFNTSFNLSKIKNPALTCCK